MQNHELTIYFVVILLVNSITLLITVYAAIRKPTWSYRLIGLAALGAFIGALAQVIHLHFILFATLSTFSVVLMLSIRLFIDRRKHYLD